MEFPRITIDSSCVFYYDENLIQQYEAQENSSLEFCCDFILGNYKNGIEIDSGKSVMIISIGIEDNSKIRVSNFIQSSEIYAVMHHEYAVSEIEKLFVNHIHDYCVSKSYSLKVGGIAI